MSEPTPCPGFKIIKSTNILNIEQLVCLHVCLFIGRSPPDRDVGNYFSLKILNMYVSPLQVWKLMGRYGGGHLC